MTISSVVFLTLVALAVSYCPHTITESCVMPESGARPSYALDTFVQVQDPSPKAEDNGVFSNVCTGEHEAYFPYYGFPEFNFECTITSADGSSVVSNNQKAFVRFTVHEDGSLSPIPRETSKFWNRFN